MRYAESIRYGGQLIEAKDCDHSSYKHLGLLCPECKNPVFLRAAHQRISPKSKEVAEVEASFAHFTASDPAIALQCEARVARYDRRDLERKAKAAKNQRLKFLHRWFWSVYLNWHDLERKIAELQDHAVFSEAAQMFGEMEEAQNVISGLRVFSHQQRLDLFRIHSEALNLDPAQFRSDRFKDQLKSLIGIDRTLHILVCTEVLEFLCAKRQNSLLEQVLLCCAGMLGVSPTAQAIIESGQERVEAMLGRHLLSSICLIDWAGEFERLATDGKKEA